MRQRLLSASFVIGGLLAGCMPAPDASTGTLFDVVTNLVPGLGVTEPAGADGASTAPPAPATAAASAAPAAAQTVQGSVSSDGFVLYELGPGRAGDVWSVGAPGGFYGQGVYLVVLFDAQQDLLYRQIVSPATRLEHVLRRDTDGLYLGIAPPAGRSGGSFEFTVRQVPGGACPAARPQVVWVNFAGGSDVGVHRRAGITFPPFEAGLLGARYAASSVEVKSAILAAMRADYARYSVDFLCSDDGPPPDDAVAVLHFGGNDARLLGLADSVDQYNTDTSDAAIIYVEAFTDFSVMDLTADEMGQMIGNVASHELGHLLGLFHTRVPTDLMDTTGTAWDLAVDQQFERGALEETVFPVGFENSPARLADTVGERSDVGEPATKQAPTARALRKLALRALVREQMRCRCGNCLNPDE